MKLMFTREITPKRFLSASNFNIKINAKDLFFRKALIDLNKNEKLLSEKNQINLAMGTIALKKAKLQGEIIKLNSQLSEQLSRLKNCQKELDEIQFESKAIESLKNYKLNSQDKDFIDNIIEFIYLSTLEGNTFIHCVGGPYSEYPNSAVATCFRIYGVTFKNEFSKNGSKIGFFLHAVFPRPENFKLDLIEFADSNLSDIEKLLQFTQEGLSGSIKTAQQIINKDFLRLKKKLYDPLINNKAKEAFILYKGSKAAIFKLQDLIIENDENINIHISNEIIAAERAPRPKNLLKL